jgi:hypothetical protein
MILHALALIRAARWVQMPKATLGVALAGLRDWFGRIATGERTRHRIEADDAQSMRHVMPPRGDRLAPPATR